MTRYVIHKFQEKQEIKGIFLTDLHYPENDRAFIRRVLKRDYDFILFGGDITEGVTLHSPGASVTGPSEKLGFEQFKEDLTLIKPDMVMEMVLGNHDNRSLRATGQDLSLLEEVCNNHKIGFSRNHTIICFQLFGDYGIKVCLTHGGGGGATEQSIINVLKRTRDAVDSTCDLYLCGHFHKYVWCSEDFRGSRVMPRSGNLTPYTQTQYLGSCGSPHTWEGSYAEGGPKGRPFRSCSIKGMELTLKGPTSHDPKYGIRREIQHTLLH